MFNSSIVGVYQSEALSEYKTWQLPISVFWVNPADVVLQLHVSFLLEALDL